MAFGAILGQRPGVQSVNNVLPDVQGNVTLNAGNVGAAPAGYVDAFYSVSDFNALLSTVDNVLSATKQRKEARLAFSVANWTDYIPSGEYIATVFKEANGYALLTVKCNTVQLQNQLYNSTWKGWEWVSPLMQQGVEYRTMEQWNGKVVYTKLVNCGIARNDATITLDGVSTCVRFIGYVGYPNETDPRKQLPIWSGSTIGTDYHVEITQPVTPYSVNQFIIKTDSNEDGFGNGGYNWWVHVWYTKD